MRIVFLLAAMCILFSSCNREKRCLRQEGQFGYDCDEMYDEIVNSLYPDEDMIEAYAECCDENE